MIIKNEIPILEYDDCSAEVIAPDHDLAGIQLPEKCLFTFLGDVVHRYAKDNNAEVVEELITVSHNIKIYVLHEKDDICLVQSTIGAPAAAQVMDSLVSCGCKKVIAVGSCGVLASRYIELDEEPVAAIEDCFKSHDLPFVTCTTWTTDEFFRETKDMVKYRLEEGCSVVEMECAALAAVCRKRGAKFGQFLFTADSLANVHEYDARGFGTDSHEKALLLGLDVLRGYK